MLNTGLNSLRSARFFFEACHKEKSFKSDADDKSSVLDAFAAISLNQYARRNLSFRHNELVTDVIIAMYIFL